MSDDKSKADKPDHAKPASHEDYEVQYLIIKYNVSRMRALELISKHGGNRERTENELNASDL